MNLMIFIHPDNELHKVIDRQEHTETIMQRAATTFSWERDIHLPLVLKRSSVQLSWQGDCGSCCATHVRLGCIVGRIFGRGKAEFSISCNRRFQTSMYASLWHEV
jgi:hypothetical protein